MDKSTALLLDQLRVDLANTPSSPEALWLADENMPIGTWSQLAPYAAYLQALTNRYDHAIAAAQSNVPHQFCDWDFSSLPLFNHIYLRICKEKAVNLHLLEQAAAHLHIGGSIHLAGAKNEGIKSCWDYANELLPSSTRLKKSGDTYVGTLTKSLEREGAPDNSYHQMQQVGEWDGQPIYSKPGVYGWDKIDAGSALLIEQLALDKQTWAQAKSVLDLGCGYGFLTFASHWISCERRVATDNNAAALICTQKNINERNISAEVLAADKAESVDGKFDLILCNPPFHRGFDIDSDLTRDFLQAAQKKLAPAGTAVFVVNSFIPIEKKTAGLFSRSRLLTDTRQFKVLALQR